MKKWAFGLVTVCGVLLAGCTTGGTENSGNSTSSSGKAAVEQVFNVVVQQEMPSADLSLATDTISFSALNNVYEGLYRLDADSKPQPAGAAELAEVSEDGLTYRLKLREDAKWSNGNPVTAADYVYGWQRTVKPETGSEYAYLYAPVKNAESITAGKTDPSELGIKAVSDYELEITLEKATPYFDYLLAFPSFFPQNQATVEEKGDQYATASDQSIYNGPFVLNGFDGPGTDTEWSYEKNEHYWDQENVSLQTINVSVVKESATALNLFQDGQADDVILTGELAQQMANDEAFVSEPLARTSYIEFNQREDDSPFRNADLRKAISYAIDREALVTSILGDGSLVSTGLIPQGMTFSPIDNKDFVEDAGSVIEYNEEKAKEHWEKAKAALGIDSLEFEFLASDTDSTKKVIEYVQSAVESTLDGIKIELSPVPFSVRLDRSNNGDFEMLMSGWGADYADASSFTDLFVTGNSYNRGRWSNEDYDAAVNASTVTHAGDPEARWQDLLEAEKIIMSEQAVVPVFQNVEAHLRSPNVTGVVSHGAGAQYDYKWASVTE
jgi:oligopeptide transport system substrate-binding protein